MSERVDFQTLVRPASPNTFLLAPEGFCSSAKADAASPVFPLAPDALFDRLVSLIGNTKGWKTTLQDSKARHVEAVATTKVLKFKDDIAFEVVSDTDPEKSKLAVYSRSRVGYHDLGANRKRVEWLLAELKQSR